MASSSTIFIEGFHIRYPCLVAYCHHWISCVLQSHGRQVCFCMHTSIILKSIHYPFSWVLTCTFFPASVVSKILIFPVTSMLLLASFVSFLPHCSNLVWYSSGFTLFLLLRQIGVIFFSNLHDIFFLVSEATEYMVHTKKYVYSLGFFVQWRPFIARFIIANIL